MYYPASVVSPSVLGLRLQILLALAAAFAVAFALLSVVSVRITQRSRAADRFADAEATARALAAGLTELPPGVEGRRRFHTMAAHVVGSGGVRGVELVDQPVDRPGIDSDSDINGDIDIDRDAPEPRRGREASGSDGAPTRTSSTWTRGITGLGTPVDATIPGHAGDSGRPGTVRLWVRPPAPGSSPFGAMLRAYLALSGGFILLLATGVLTVLIVRPVEAVTRAAGRLADGKLDQDVPVRGAAEVVELAVTFNRMARQLRADKQALEARLEELEQKTLALAAARDQVVRGERLASVGRLAAGVAHEIGNPLSAILGLIELLRDASEDEMPEETRREFLGRIQKETERIHHIIRDLLDFSRQAPTAGPEADQATVDLTEVVEETLRLLAPQRELSRLTITRDVQGELPHARGEHDACAQIALNLLLNAADAIDGEGEVRVSLREETRDDTDAEATPGPGPGRYVRLDVSDSGPGIAPEVVETLFEPFVTTKPVGRGTGLGLAVVHSLVERMGATIDVRNARDGGAVFSLWFRAVAS